MIAAITLTGRRAPVTTSAAVFAVVLAVHAALGMFIGVHGWDDGSITLAFARTFADSGRIALTPSSEVVEGFSSPFWFLLSATTDVVLPLGFAGMIAASQLWSAFFAAVGALLLFRLLPMPALQAGLVSVLVFCYAPFLNESVNGMEMTALSVLVLGIASLLLSDGPRATVGLALLGALAPWIRLEAGGYVAGAAVIGMFVIRDRRRAVALLVGTIASLVILTALRLAIFDALLPNTMYAKQSSPYSTASLAERLPGAKTVIKEVLLVSAPGLAIALLALLEQTSRPRPAFTRAVARVKARNLDPAVAFIAGYFACVAGFNLLIGPNWGYLGRMEQSLVALVVLATALIRPATWRPPAVPIKVVALVAIMLGLTYYGLDKVRFAERADPDSQVAITPDEYRQTGETMEDVRARLDLPTLEVMTADVGGTSLCCANLTIDDLGLLSNGAVAREGWKAMPGYLADARPDVIVTHSVWSQASQLYAIDFFRANYSPVVVRNMWFYLRKDHLAALSGACSTVTPDAVSTAWYRGADIDEDYIRSLGPTPVCLIA